MVELKASRRLWSILARCLVNVIGTDRPGARNARITRLLEHTAPLLFVAIAAIPLFRRLRHPTIVGDDVTRLVALIERPFRDVIFLPFAEHVTPLFQFGSWVIWQAIGHDIRLAPLAYCLASVAVWGLVLSLLGLWLFRETGSRTATFIAVALVAQSPLVRETAWWYSASSFSWAVCGILIAMLGAAGLGRRRGSLALVALGAAIAPAGTSLGFLGAPLAMLRALLQGGVSRRQKLLAILAAAAGVLAYAEFCNWGAPSVSSMRLKYASVFEPMAGLCYALTVPGRLLWPSTGGVPASWLAGPVSGLFAWGTGAVALAMTAWLAISRRAHGNGKLVVIGAFMIYCGYLLAYVPRVCTLRLGMWSELQLLYQFAARYHILPLMGLAAIVSATIAGFPLAVRGDARPGRPALLGAIVGLAMLGVQFKEASFWDFYLVQPDQRSTLAAVHRLGQLAREEGIPRTQLVRIIDPVMRPWNQSILGDRPEAFPLVKLGALAPEEVTRPIADSEARARLKARLTASERTALGSDMCASFSQCRVQSNATTLAIARRYELRGASEIGPGLYRNLGGAGAINFEFEPAPGARYLVMPGLKSNQDIHIYWCDQNQKWRPGQCVRWLKSSPGAGQAVIDLDRLIHLSTEPLSRIAIQFTQPGGELALRGAPRLVR